MAKHVLTNNFFFLEDSIDFPNKEELINEIQKLENLAKSKEQKLDDLLSYRKIYNLLVDTLYSTYINVDENLNTLEKNEKICGAQILSDDKLWYSLNQIKIYGNRACHSTELKTSDLQSVQQSEMITNLKSIYLLVKKVYLYLNEDNLKDENKIRFSDDFYTTKDAYENLNIRIKKDNDELNKVLPLSKSTFEIIQISICDFLLNHNLEFNIPIYQRGYSWTNINIENLLIDINRRTNDRKNHYFGVIAYKEKGINEKNNKTIISILDGQQRLTTTALLLCAIRDILTKIKKVNLFDLDIGKTSDLKFKNPGGSNDANNFFKKIIDGKIDFQNDRSNKDYYIQNYFQILNEYKDKRIDDIKSLYACFRTKFMIGCISFERNLSKKDEIEIFENLNSKGKALELYDLLKNWILSLCSDEILENDEDELVIQFNMTFGAITCDEESKKDIITSFFISLIKYFTGKETPNNNYSSFLNNLKLMFEKIYDVVLHKTFNKSLEYHEYPKILELINRYFAIYCSFILNDKNSNVFTYIKTNLKIDRYYSLLLTSKRKGLIPAIYLIFDSFFSFTNKLKEFNQGINFKKDFAKKIYLAVKILIYRFIFTEKGDSETARIIAKVASKFFDQIKNLPTENEKINILDNFFKELKNELINNIDIFHIISNITKKPGWEYIAILRMCSWELLGDNYELDPGMVNPSYEHIMPQNNAKWINHFKDIYPDKNEEEIKELYETCVHKLGNGLIIPGNWNSKLKNLSFNDKKTFLNGRLNSPLYANDDSAIDIKSKTDWTFEDIEKRNVAICKLIVEKVFKDLK